MSGRCEPTEDAALKASLKAQLEALGFVRVGVAAAGRLEPEATFLREFIEKGYHGEMGWMADTEAVRADPTDARMLDQARSIVVVAAPYADVPRGKAQMDRIPGGGFDHDYRVARYAWGRDYHNVLQKRLRKAAQSLRDQGFETRVAVDSMPVFERAWAERAGVGFVGKNCCLIVPGVGSHVFLAALVTTAPLPSDAPMARRCGTCTRCLDACPTRAFEGAHQLDGTRCIAYLTIEQRGPIPEPLREGVGGWLFGCDECQDVCPFNRTDPGESVLLQAFQRDARFEDAPIERYFELDDASFREWAQGSAIKRTGAVGLARNAAVVLGNVGTRRHLPILQRVAESYPSDVVREAAVWATARIEAREDDEDDA